MLKPHLHLATEAWAKEWQDFSILISPTLKTSEALCDSRSTTLVRVQSQLEKIYNFC